MTVTHAHITAVDNAASHLRPHRDWLRLGRQHRGVTMPECRMERGHDRQAPIRRHVRPAWMRSEEGACRRHGRTRSGSRPGGKRGALRGPGRRLGGAHGLQAHVHRTLPRAQGDEPEEEGIEVFHDEARFTGGSEVSVGVDRLEASRAVVIAAGDRPTSRLPAASTCGPAIAFLNCRRCRRRSRSWAAATSRSSLLTWRRGPEPA